MNILMALSQLEVTGAEVYATTIGDKLIEKGHQVFFVSDTLTKPTQGTFFKLRFNKRSIPRRFWHVAYLIWLIKKHKIQLVHAHSRASGWSSYIACKLTGTPMITTVHGRQPVHASRKAFHALGYAAVAVCEDIEQQLIDSLGVPADQIHVIRNGIETKKFTAITPPHNDKPLIIIVGRLTGPKGNVCYRLLDEVIDLKRYRVQVISGSQVTERFQRFQNSVEFVGYVQDIPARMQQADLVIGAGRVAMESLLCGRPTLAIGEAKAIGLITPERITEALASNFGDIGPKDLDIDFPALIDEIENGIALQHTDSHVRQQIQQEYDLNRIVTQLEQVYQDAYIYTRQREVPVIMYHRFIQQDSEKGVHGTWLPVSMLEKHFKLLKWLGYETLTFQDLAEHGFIHRLQPGKKFIIITVDDGYRDNLTLLLPLLKKYNFKAVIYAVSGENHNRWDVDVSENPDRPVPLMTPDELTQIANSGYVEIGGHTLTHPHLSKLTATEQQHQIVENKKVLEQLLGKTLISFAYPYGDYNEQSKILVAEAGYPFAVATNSGPLAMHQDNLAIRRIAIFPKTDVFGLWRKIRGNYVFRKFK
ncbi:MAG: polysaccharide deacetylase family protein [Tolumonas sp.]|nr:polysaccharide deacetylase family protein [Tolumonas sp.]